jgi:carbon-monoxide dehydrogenase medium subunit
VADFTRGTFETAVQQGELLTGILVPVPDPEGTGFAEISRRKGDFAVVSAGARLRVDGDGICQQARVVLGAVTSVPLRCTDVEAELIGVRPTAEAIARAAAAAPIDRIEFDHRDASRAYRRQVAPVLIRRALMQAAGRPGVAIQ